MRKKSIHAPRPRYQDKCKAVLAAMRRLIYRQALDGYRSGYMRMSEIAEEAGYARSQRFMETLYSMCDDGLLEKKEWNTGKGITGKEVVFRLPVTHKQQSFA